MKVAVQQATPPAAVRVGRDVRHAPSRPLEPLSLRHDFSQLRIAPPGGGLEAEAREAAARVSRGEHAAVAQRAPAGVLQRDFVTEPPEVAAPAQPDLTDAQIQSAIAFNRARYDAANTRLIQSLIGGPVTGTWTEENIVAIASTQEEYGLKKDGKVGHDTFVFLQREQQGEGMSTATENCLVAFRLIGPTPATFSRTSPTVCHLGSEFRTESEFSSRCNCSQFQYRQFIRGHFARTRGSVTEDIGAWFSDLPGDKGHAAGRIDTTFKEDGDTTDPTVHFGHREEAADATTRYFDRAGTNNQRSGCRFESEDAPGGDVLDCQPGDVYDIEVSFRGEIQRNGSPIQQKFWTAIRRANWRP